MGGQPVTAGVATLCETRIGLDGVNSTGVSRLCAAEQELAARISTAAAVPVARATDTALSLSG
jgi:hypothetical protein